MPETPGPILDAVRRAVERFPGDVDASVAAAIENVRQLPEQGDVLEWALGYAIREAVYHERHHTNRQIRRDTANRRAAERHAVVPGTATTQLMDAYAMKVAGRVLGDIRGCELAELARMELELSGGHLKNYRLFAALSRRVAGELRVRDAVTVQQLTEIIRRTQATNGRTRRTA